MKETDSIHLSARNYRDKTAVISPSLPTAGYLSPSIDGNLYTGRVGLHKMYDPAHIYRIFEFAVVNSVLSLADTTSVTECYMLRHWATSSCISKVEAMRLHIQSRIRT